MGSSSTLITQARMLQNNGISPSLSVRLMGEEIQSVSPSIAPIPGERIVECGGRLLVPPVLDLHVHGGGGASFLSSSIQEIRQACRAQFLYGTGWLLATLLLAPFQRWWDALEAIERVIKEQETTPQEAKILGAYLEGPFLNPEMSGGMDGHSIAHWTPELFRRVLERFRGVVRVITLAPEVPHAEEILAMAKDAGVLVFLGHSSANYSRATEAIARGAAGITHLFNAMRPYHHREPGVLGAALLSTLFCEMIAEPAHLHPASWEMALRLKGEGGVAPVSDGSPLAAGGSARRVGLSRQGTAALTSDGRLCGTAVSLLQGLAILHREGTLPIHQGLKMANGNAGRLLGIDLPGELEEGYRGPVFMVDPHSPIPVVEVV